MHAAWFRWCLASPTSASNSSRWGQSLTWAEKGQKTKTKTTTETNAEADEEEDVPSYFIRAVGACPPVTLNHHSDCRPATNWNYTSPSLPFFPFPFLPCCLKNCHCTQSQDSSGCINSLHLPLSPLPYPHPPFLKVSLYNLRESINLHGFEMKNLYPHIPIRVPMQTLEMRGPNAMDHEGSSWSSKNHSQWRSQ